jgi:hypothetical protein
VSAEHPRFGYEFGQVADSTLEVVTERKTRPLTALRVFGISQAIDAFSFELGSFEHFTSSGGPLRFLTFGGEEQFDYLPESRRGRQQRLCPREGVVQMMGSFA